MNQTTAQGADRREFFRINDQVALHFRVVDEQEIAVALKRKEEGEVDSNAIVYSFSGANLEMKHAIEKCRRDAPEVASCLESLNTKLDLLIRLMIASRNEFPDHPTHEVNLSASGCSFRAREKIRPGTLLEIKLLFFPSFLHVLTYGRVVRCEQEDNEPLELPFHVATEFTHLQDNEQELLIRHILQKESAMLRAARRDPVSDA